ncbi:MAG: gliding motility-associated C-terminal domain-containing protein [Candidatus Pseudobacter hemicellulosilyticus]|uniref:Gliding motility-associated C-terminal domain-containing protein n=1 Tax=Candidatus Pseudobacter hemicellulosilyticus TaxID=3121375 RepID=A0AAJ5WN17_9BACT|nr:MAG: gliding motility-associated C-terminal domain-containing protein [Pseudobacter sp.]
MRLLALLSLLFFLSPAYTIAQVFPSFTAPDTVCVGAPVNITNTSIGASNYYWNFCTANINTAPDAVNLGNLGNQLNWPVFMDYAEVNGNYYAFVVNHMPGSLIRLDFGNSLLNTPTTVNLGNFNGVAGSVPNPEGIQVIQNDGEWYIIIVGGINNDPGRTKPYILKVELGANINNNNPAFTNWGNIGNLGQPTDLHMFREGNHWYGLSLNAVNNSITRFDFGTDFNNPPQGLNLGDLGVIRYPTGIYAINDNGYWRAFVTTEQSGLIRLDFGSSMTNIPTAVGLGSFGVKLRDITIIRYCDDIRGFAVDGATNQFIRLNFSSLSAAPTHENLGNLGSLSFPHSISTLFRVKDDVYTFTTNVDNNTITRFRFRGCTNSSLANSSQKDPGSITYNRGGIYNITLTIDEGQPTQSSFCKQVVVQENYASDFNYDQAICNPLSIQFANTNPNIPVMQWDFGDGGSNTSSLTPAHAYPAFGDYTVTFTVPGNKCTAPVSKTISINVTPEDVILTPDTVVCAGASKRLRTSAALEVCWSPTDYLDDPTSHNPVTRTPHDITYYAITKSTGTNLITNGDFSSGNNGFSSQYTYSSTSNGEGFYYISGNVPAWHGGLAGCSDHTGNGNMMMVNGAAVANQVVWSQTVTVQPNTNYAFSTWIASLHSSNPAQLQFSINGRNLGNMIQASSATCRWDQFYTTWNSGNSTTATISIVNQNLILAGNDFALDDISFAPVLLLRDQVSIKIETPVVTTGNDTLVCQDFPVPLRATGAATYSWSPVTGIRDPLSANPIVIPPQTTEYTVTGTTVNGCVAQDKILISTINKPAIHQLTADTLICLQGSVELRAAASGTAPIYQWQPDPTLSNTGIPNPIATPSVPTRYYLEVTGDNGCINRDSVLVDFLPYPEFKGPGNQVICSGYEKVLSASGGDSYTWTPGQYLDDHTIASPAITPFSAGNYSVYIRDNTCGFDSTIFFSVRVNPTPLVTAMKSGDINCVTHRSRLVAVGAANYLWTPALGLDSARSATPIAAIDKTTEFIVQGTNQFGCAGYDTIVVAVKVEEEPVFRVPNAFTPNGDGKNDCFGIRQWGAAEIREFTVFNRYGQRLFTSNNVGKCWDGTFKNTPQPGGQYVYVIKAGTVCGEITRTGVFYLIR